MAESFPAEQSDQDRLDELRIQSAADLIRGGAKIHRGVLSPTGVQREIIEANTIHTDLEAPHLGWASFDDLLGYCKSVYPDDELSAQRMATRIENKVIMPLNFEEAEKKRGGRKILNDKDQINLDVLESEMGRFSSIRKGHFYNVRAKTVEVVDGFIETRRAALEQLRQQT